MHDSQEARTSNFAKPDHVWLTIPEAAVYLSVSSDTIRRRIKDKKLPASIFSRKYRIHVDDLDALVKAA